MRAGCACAEIKREVSALTWKPSCSSSSRLAARISPHYVVLLRETETEGKLNVEEKEKNNGAH